ncbi:MAG TPA: tRNA preQ1(34) S-adenosylmethionine ribosyltransferase-isomerase QueA [Pyrinomonadaceae bacterium]|jgi:S-adenosylmethionine:tRNA ribosyltransferase-isomerase
MQISDFDYELPEELIAQEPLGRRDASRMLVVERARGVWRDSSFSELPAEIAAGDTLVFNNTRVFPARLTGRREPSGGRIELLLVRQLTESDPHAWETLARPARRLERGSRISFGDGQLRAEVTEVSNEGVRVVRFECEGDFQTLLDEIGQTPLPPYIKRGDGQTQPHERLDRERYQTIYARQRGAIAAPTAGLHFTPRVVEELRARGARLVELTLHVGYGTFAPVRAVDLSEHRVAPERYSLDAEAASIINATRAQGGRIVAIGTTTVRALESAATEDGRVEAQTGETALTITPGYRFRAVDALLTNFHLPRSSLLVLVGAFMGRSLALDAYRHAVRSRYRFYSYGDCMLIT